MNKITIGLFIDTYYPMIDGVISVVDNYAKNLMKYANIIVFCPEIDKNYDDSIHPYKIIRCKSISNPLMDYKLPSPHIDKNFLNKLKNSNLDIVHVHSPFLIGKLGLKYAKKHKIPCIATMHTQYKKDVYKIVKNKYLTNIITNSIINTFEKFDECWAVNSEVARIFKEEYNYSKLPRVMNNATEMTLVEDEKAAKKYIQDKYKIKNNELIFLFVGRINLLKNIIFIADSIKLLKEKKPKLKFKMLFVGTGQDESILINHIKELELENEIILCGKISNRKELEYHYKEADLFLFPSTFDASSIVQIEAASQKTPGLFIKGSCTAATITDNVNGFLSNNNIEDYTNRIIEIIENKKLYKKVSEQCYKDIYINWNEYIKEVYNLYIKKINETK